MDDQNWNVFKHFKIMFIYFVGVCGYLCHDMRVRWETTVGVSSLLLHVGPEVQTQVVRLGFGSKYHPPLTQPSCWPQNLSFSWLSMLTNGLSDSGTLNLSLTDGRKKPNFKWPQISSHRHPWPGRETQEGDLKTLCHIRGCACGLLSKGN